MIIAIGLSFLISSYKWNIVTLSETIILHTTNHFRSFIRMVSSYLVHHGYSSTAESFAKATEQNLNEEMSSIKTRQSNVTFADCI